ncbi:MAG: hypothetical protein VW985_13270, partial [Gammaproteobacteria bacterium]
GNMNPILGLMRTDAIKSVAIINTVGADLIMLSDLALRGYFVHAIGTHWSRREFRHELTHDDKVERYRSESQGFTRTKLERLFPVLRLPYEILAVLWRSKLSLAEKILAMISFMASTPARYYCAKKKHG